MITRREMGGLAIGLAAFAAGCGGSSSPAGAPPLRGTPFWRIRKGAGEMILLGVGDAKDTSWLTPALQAAFDASGEVWLETAPQNQVNPAEIARAQQYMNLTEGTFFDTLEPHLVPRVKARLAELDVPESRIERRRAWWAYYAINGAWWGKHPVGYTEQPVDQTLAALAQAAGKPVSYEFPGFGALAEFMAGMPAKAQSQYIEWLLDTQDARAAGESDYFGWIEGRRPEASLARMQRLPGLYAQMQRKRNRWWADKIAALLDEGKQAFIAVGQLHVMGPDGIPAQLATMGVRLQPAV